MFIRNPKIKIRQIRLLTPLVIYFITHKQFLCLGNSASKKICNEIVGNYETNDFRTAVVNDIGNDNVITGMIITDSEFYGVITSSFKGSVYFVNYLLTLEFRFEDCKLFWSNGISFVKEGCQIQTA